MMRIVSHAIPVDNEQAFQRGLAETQRGLARAVAARLPADASFADRERAVLAAANEACRLTLVDVLRHQVGARTYHSLCGPLPVLRATYREVGAHNGPTVVPLDLETGLIAGATPALAYRVALGYAQGLGRRAEEQMHADHRQPPSRSTLERLGKAIGTQTHRVASRIEPLVRDEETLPAGAHAIVVGLDRTTVPMEEPRAACTPPPTRRKTRTTPYVRTAPAPVDVQYRMAYVGTVSVVDRVGEALRSTPVRLAQVLDRLEEATSAGFAHDSHTKANTADASSDTSTANRLN